ncbi:hypothetical protein JH285_15390 [Xanthomonas campestris pv. campestris]|uniref:hypothetical protein n=1 Tax=Xanthomonas campestris TaxID=339 RepID=UPI0023798349|nr:hypothetical protein [Xanthomonas campestris]WDL16674.1 hypothetical protein JH285_15390 [Xanthomonas campestris pv. campestris]
MIIVGRLYRVLRRHVRRVSWGMVALALLAHMSIRPAPRGWWPAITRRSNARAR